MKPELKIYDDKMQKSVSALERELSGIRAGRASAAVLEKIKVDYYGTPTPINNIAAVSVPEPRSLVIQPWDAGIVKAVEKAIQSSDIGINPQNDGRSIRLNFPPLTEERRKELVKQVSKKAEEGKVAIRNIRRDAIEIFKAQKKKSEITEDDLKTLEKELQDLHDKYIKECEAASAKKEKEILEI
jgi:ribosome recycling factor